MDSGLPVISYAGLLLVSCVLIIFIFLVKSLRLNLAKTIAIAGVRAAVQLFSLGWILAFLFKQENLLLDAAAIFVMTLAASHTAIERTKVRYAGIRLHTFLSIAIASWALAAFAIFFILPKELHSRSSAILPFVGLLLGNSLSGISLGMTQWLERITKNRDRIEFWLSHGATRWEAIQMELRESMHTAITPIVNAMAVAGLVSLPGMVTGQLLAGADPQEAVKFQIVVLFLVTVATFLGSLIAILLSYRCLFNTRHQFLSDKFLLVHE